MAKHKKLQKPKAPRIKDFSSKEEYLQAADNYLSHNLGKNGENASNLDVSVDIKEPVLADSTPAPTSNPVKPIPTLTVTLTATRKTTPKANTIENSQNSFTYNVTDRFDNDNTGRKAIQQNAGLVIGVARIKYPDLYDFSKSRSTAPSGISTEDTSYPVSTYDVFQIQDACISAQTISNKGSHVNSFSGVFTDPHNKLMHLILPGDWIMVWMTDNIEDAKVIEVKLQNKQQANDFMSGLKFVGKVNSIRKNISITRNGEKVRRVNINAFGFSEFDDNIYYDPDLILDTNIKNFYASIVGDPDKAIQQIFNETPDQILQDLIIAFLGEGPHNNTINSNGQKLVVSPNANFLVPSIIGTILGKDKPSKGGGQLTYSDILSSLLGTQNYDGNADTPWEGFAPKFASNSKYENRFKTPNPLQGKFYNQVTPWQNIPIWNALSSFLNSTVNEMYNTLRTDPISGRIVPFTIARQKPFTTNAYYKANPDYPVTTFLSLPRWNVDPSMVLSLNIGRSDSLRVNVCQVISICPLASLADAIASIQKEQTHLWMDIQDVKRNGLRGSFELTNCLPNDPDDPSAFGQWGKFKADQLINGHLKYNGTITTKGIQAPICIGDNLEFDGNVYHIEQVSHKIDIDANGTKIFTTEIQLSNGVYKDAEYTHDLWPEINLIVNNNEEIEMAGNITNTEDEP